MDEPRTKFQCLVCPKLLTSREYMRRHLLIQHQISDMSADHYARALVWLKRKPGASFPQTEQSLSQPRSSDKPAKFQTPFAAGRAQYGETTSDRREETSIDQKDETIDIRGESIGEKSKLVAEAVITAPSTKIGIAKKSIVKEKKEKVKKVGKAFSFFQGLTSEVDTKIETFKMFSQASKTPLDSSNALSPTSAVQSSNALPSVTAALQTSYYQLPTIEVQSCDFLSPVSPVRCSYSPPVYSNYALSPTTEDQSNYVPSQPATTFDVRASTRHNTKQKKKHRSPKSCDDTECEPCSVVANCNRCVFCLNRSRLR